MAKTHPCIMVERVEALESAAAEDRRDRVEILRVLSAVEKQAALTNQSIVGNGVKGLAERMDEQEKATALAAQNAVTPEKVTEIAHTVIETVLDRARGREKTTVAKLKALGPWAVPFLILGVIWVLSNLLHWAPPVLPGVSP